MEIDVGRLVDALPGLVWVTSAGGRTGFVNQGWCAFTGQTVEQARRNGWEAAVHPDDAQLATCRWTEIIGSGLPDVFEVRLRRSDGDCRAFRLHARPVSDASGQVNTWCGFAAQLDDKPQRVREQDLWEFVDKLPPHFVFLAPGGEVQHVNRAIQLYYGRSLDELKGWTQSDALHPDDRERVVSTWAAAIAAGGTETYDTTHRSRRHDGVYRWMNAQMFPYWGEDGRLVRWISLNTDVDDLKRAQLLLEGEVRILEKLAQDASPNEVLETFCQVVEGCTDRPMAGVLVKDPSRTSLEVAAAPSIPDGRYGILAIEAIVPFERLHDAGAGREQPIICCDPAQDLGLGAAPWAAQMREAGLRACWLTPIISGAQVLGVFALYGHAPGQPSDAERRVMARFAAIAGIAISKARADAALKDQESELRKVNRDLVDAQSLSRVGSYTADLSIDEYSATEELRRIWEFEPEARISTAMILSRIHPDDRAAFEIDFNKTLTTNEDSNFSFRIVTPSGVVRHLHSVSRVLKHVEGGLVVVGIQQDETERVHAEQALRASEAELLKANRELEEAQALSHVGSFSADLLRDDHMWSDEMRRIWEFEACDRISLADIRSRIHPDDRAGFEAEYPRLLERGESSVAFRIVTPSGKVKHLRSASRIVDYAGGGPVVVGTHQDETERVHAAEALKTSEDALSRARADLARVDRAMALGALTASIAHEVNQPLAGIVANAATCQRMLAAEPPNIEGARATSQRLVRDGNRAAEVIQRLRALFANKLPPFEAVDLNEAAAEVLALSSAELQSAKVAVRSMFEPALPPVRGDRVQLQQVILNLVLNAADAMRSVSGRVRDLTISTVREADDSVRLSVRDAGVGVDPDNVERLFEAFHTTKESGMGIGLAVSRSIIESHDGRLWAEPNAGPGATFAFAIPAHPGNPPPSVR